MRVAIGQNNRSAGMAVGGLQFDGTGCWDACLLLAVGMFPRDGATRGVKS
jgi:hypothetical protein